jgi:hypothetical protein
LSLAVLVAFGLQSFLVQTHLHYLPLSLQPMGVATAAAPGDAKAPLDADKCYLCQEYLHGGSYLTPAAIAVLPPSAVVSLLPLALVSTAPKRAVSHNWMGRAPPHTPV